MKIGIYTLPLNFNYGGLLQAFALQTILNSMGHETLIIDRELFPSKKINWKSIQTYKNIIKKYILRRIEYIDLGKYLHDTYPICTQYTEPFVNKYIKRIVVDDDITIELPEFDVLICGSDQIWRRRFHKSQMKVYNSFLQFADSWNVKRISYAASLGVDIWEYSIEETKRIKYLISKFDAVSVRENSGVKLLKDNLGIDSCHVLDPTLLLESEDYIRLLNIDKEKKSEGELLVYILDKTDYKQELVDFASKVLNLRPFVVNSQAENYCSPIKNRIQPPVEKWLRGFLDAKFIITDSFHACVFSILFKKTFYVVGNRKRGMARIESILSILGLENRIIETKEDIKDINIDYAPVLEKLNILRSKSMEYLNNSL